MNIFHKLVQRSLTALLCCGFANAHAGQIVFVDFDSGTDDVINYSNDMRDGVIDEMRRHFAPFDVEITLNPTLPPPQSRIIFNSGDPGGMADGIDFGNYNKNDNAVVNVGGLLTNPTESEIIYASAALASHQLGHLMGLRHADSMGLIGDGLPITGLPAASDYAPAYPGPSNAQETTDHLMATPSSVGSSIDDIVLPLFFSERSAAKLALAEQGALQDEADGPALEKQAVDVPNTLDRGGYVDAELLFDLTAVQGEISAGDEVDVYELGHVGEGTLSVEVISAMDSFQVNVAVDTIVTVKDNAGNPLPHFSGTATNDNEFESTDSSLIDIELPSAPGTLQIEVKSVNPAVTGDYLLYTSTFRNSLTLPTNRPPFVFAPEVSTPEDTAVDIVLEALDPDGDDVTFTVGTGPNSGTLTGTPPNLTYLPNANFEGMDSFTIFGSDGLLIGQNTAQITVTPVNDAPTADEKVQITEEDVFVEITLSGADIDGDPIHFEIVTNPASGTLTPGSTNDSRTYRPNLNFSGDDEFTYRTFDGELYSEPARVRINVSAVNDTPTADAQTVTLERNSAAAFTLTGSDPEGSALIFEVTGIPTNGTLDGTPPNLTYTPDPDFTGSDALTFTVSDGEATSAPVTVILRVTSGNLPPVGADRTVMLSEDSSIQFELEATDPEGQPLFFSMARPPLFGTVSGTLPHGTYTPRPDFNGTDSFFYAVSDRVYTELFKLTLIVAPVNDPPVADEKVQITEEDTPVEITFTGSDVDNAGLTFEVVSSPASGTLSPGASPNVRIYTPNPDFAGDDVFTYQASDGEATSEPARVRINVSAVNDAPTADPQAVAVDTDSAVVFTLSGSDPEGDSLTFEVVSTPPNGTLDGSPPDLTYTPFPGFTGTDTFTFATNDGQATSAPATVTITVGSNNTPPVATPQTLSTFQEVQLIVLLSGNDADGDELSFRIVDAPSNGMLRGTPPTVSYTGTTGFVGADSFAFVANDGMVDSEPATVTIEVNEASDDFGCNRPADLDRFTDRGSFIWRTCDGGTPLWTFQVNGGGSPQLLTSAGTIHAPGGLEALVEGSIENHDTVDNDDPELVAFELKVRNNGVDRLEFIAPPGSCLEPSVPLGPLFIGEGRMPLLNPSFSLDDGGLCVADVDSDNDGLTDAEEAIIGSNPLNPDTDGGGIQDGAEVAAGTDPLDPSDDAPSPSIACFKPFIDPSVDQGIHVWSACDGSNMWVATATAGAGPRRSVFEGVITGGMPTNVDSSGLNGNDTFDLTPDGARYQLRVSPGRRDVVRFMPAPGSCLRVDLSDGPLNLGENRVTMESGELFFDNPDEACPVWTE